MCISLSCVYKTQRASFTDRFTGVTESQNNLDYIAIEILCPLIFHLHLLSICTSMSDCVRKMLTIQFFVFSFLRCFHSCQLQTEQWTSMRSLRVFGCVLLKLVAQVWSEPQGLPSTVHFRKYSHIKNNPVLKVTTKFSNEIVAAMFLTA